MPPPILWTEARDSMILSMRANRSSWDDIGAALGINRQTALDRGRRIGAQVVLPVAIQELDHRRGVLPAGHPITWGAITAGTLLDGVAYPERLFR